MRCDAMSEQADLEPAAQAPDGPARPSAAARLWSRMLGGMAGLAIEETRVARRGFSVDQPEVRDRLEAIGGHFAWGYNHALRCGSLAELARDLAGYPGASAGFAFEGAAMGLALADWLTPGRRMFDAYIAGPARPHEYMAWVGLGWALARLPVSPERALARHHNLNKWLALDGYGFHEGYFHWPRSVRGQRRPRRLTPEAAQVFDQGLGRSLWFVCGTKPLSVATAIGLFPAPRQPDLWAGVGLAAAYAGDAGRIGWQTLRERAGAQGCALAQGVVFAAQARRRAGLELAETDLACAELLGLSVPAAASIAVQTVPPDAHSLQAYQRWRLAIQQCCAALPALTPDHVL